MATLWHNCEDTFVSKQVYSEIQPHVSNKLCVRDVNIFDKLSRRNSVWQMLSPFSIRLLEACTTRLFTAHSIIFRLCCQFDCELFKEVGSDDFSFVEWQVTCAACARCVPILVHLLRWAWTNVLRFRAHDQREKTLHSDIFYAKCSNYQINKKTVNS